MFQLLDEAPRVLESTAPSDNGDNGDDDDCDICDGDDDDDNDDDGDAHGRRW